MVALGKFVKGVFGLQALLLGLFLLLQPYLLWVTRGLHLWVGASILVAALAVLVLVFAAAWWTLRQGKPSARKWAIAASILNLPLAGLGTAVGVAGFIAFYRRETVAQLARRPRLAPLPGDGTSRITEAIANAGTMAGAIVACLWWGYWGQSHGLENHGFLTFLVLVELALLISTAVHEGGHLLAGLASEMKVRLFVVGPFEWKLRAGKWSFRFHAAGLLLGRGATGMVPTSLRNLRARRVLLSAAGPLASLLLGVVALLGLITAKGRPWEPLWELCAITASFSMLSFIGNLMPIRPEDQYSDGAHIYQILSNGPWADFHWATSVVSSSLVTPLRPRGYDIVAIHRASRLLTRGREAMLLRLFAYQHYLDSGQIPEALQSVAEAEAIYEEIAPTVPAELHTEFVFASALLKRDTVGAHVWWQRMQSKNITRFDADYWKARAAYLWTQNLLEEARDAWEKGNQLAQKLPAAGAYEFDRWCFARLRDALDSTAQHPAEVAQALS